jgi:hypothetical protein
MTWKYANIAKSGQQKMRTLAKHKGVTSSEQYRSSLSAISLQDTNIQEKSEKICKKTQKICKNFPRKKLRKKRKKDKKFIYLFCQVGSRFLWVLVG